MDAETRDLSPMIKNSPQMISTQGSIKAAKLTDQYGSIWSWGRWDVVSYVA